MLCSTARARERKPLPARSLRIFLDCVKYIDTRKYVSWEEGSADYADKLPDEPVRFRALSGDDFDGLVSEVENAFPMFRASKTNSEMKQVLNKCGKAERNA